MFGEPDEDESPFGNNNFNAVHGESKGGKSWQEPPPQVEEEHWQWTSLRRKRSPVFHSHGVQENDDGFWSSISHAPPQPDSPTDEAVTEPTSGSTPAEAVPSNSNATEEAKHADELENIRQQGSPSQCKGAVEIPPLELTKVKEIALQTKLEAGAYVCRDCQAAVATGRGGLGFQRQYPCLLYFCIFLNFMSILSFLFCISVLKTIYPHPPS